MIIIIVEYFYIMKVYSSYIILCFVYSVYCLVIRFQLKLINLNFGTKFAQKEYFWWKTEKVNITIEFYISGNGNSSLK